MRRHRRRHNMSYTQRRRLRGGTTNRRTNTRRLQGTTIKGNMPSSVMDGLRGTRITGILRKDSEHWQPLKKTTDANEHNQKGDINIYQWSVHHPYGTHVMNPTLYQNIRTMVSSRIRSYREMIRRTLINANSLQEQGYYIVDIHSDTSRPFYSKNDDDGVPSVSTDFIIFYRAYKPRELEMKGKNRRPINVVYWRRDSMNGQELDKKQASFLSKHESIDHLSTTVDSYTYNVDSVLWNTIMSSMPTRTDMRHQAEWFYA